ncbi:hypothetical protein EVAR_57308_1 [Eumeta japonica]|uniref:Uncharacterized protein n=1 Tax=Eumeta variegata TaxID=151549 RepID=A0A4C1ZF99_EUMVA|nr:hypothetical protein EVAR_57308_1 [Eumeta japonica]
MFDEATRVCVCVEYVRFKASISPAAPGILTYRAAVPKPTQIPAAAAAALVYIHTSCCECELIVLDL